MQEASMYEMSLYSCILDSSYNLHIRLTRCSHFLIKTNSPKSSFFFFFFFVQVTKLFKHCLTQHGIFSSITSVFGKRNFIGIKLFWAVDPLIKTCVFCAHGFRKNSKCYYMFWKVSCLDCVMCVCVIMSVIILSLYFCRDLWVKGRYITSI
jgi:hypothetical protein